MLRMMGYEVKSLFRSKDFLIWALLFPIAYLTIFYLALSGLFKDENPKIDTIKIGLVEAARKEAAEGEKAPTGDPIEAYYKKANASQTEPSDAEAAGDPIAEKILGMVDVLQITERAKDRADLEEDLRQNKIQGIVYQDEKGTYRFLLGRPDEVNTGILQGVLQAINQAKATEKAIIEGFHTGKLVPVGPPAFGTKMEDDNFDMDSLAQYKLESQRKPISPIYIMFYAALAYFAIYPLHMGIMCARNTQANQGAEAMRRAVSPLSKGKLFMASFVPLTIFQIIITCLAYTYISFLGIDYGPHKGYLCLVLALGNICSILMGASLSCLFPHQQSLVEGLAVGIPLFLSFLSGMMSTDVLTQLKAHAPWVLRNPLGLVSQGIYELNLGGPSRYFFQVIGDQCLTIAILACLTWALMRRRHYASL